MCPTDCFRWPEHFQSSHDLSSVCEPQDESVVARQNSPVLGIKETPEVAHLLVFLLALGIRLSVACQGFRDGCTQLLLLLGGQGPCSTNLQISVPSSSVMGL